MNTPASIAARLVASGECMVWIGSRTKRGYGRVTIDRKQRFVHRVIYEHFIGAVPSGMELDHTCRNPPCANPHHLEPVTHRENVLRGGSPAALHAKKTHCPKGHVYSQENTSYFDGGRRRCRECVRARNRIYARNYRETKEN